MNPNKKEERMRSESIVQSKAKNRVEGLNPSLEAFIADLSSHDDVVRIKARHSLVAMGKAAVPSLIEALKQTDDQVRREAVRALSLIEDPEVAPVLVRTLEDEEFDIRWLAAEGLIELGARGLKPLLQALIDRGNSSLLLEGAHHVIHYMAKGGLRKHLGPVLASLEGIEPSVKAPVAAYHGLEMLREAKII